VDTRVRAISPLSNGVSMPGGRSMRRSRNPENSVKSKTPAEAGV
jgi:hypothetical protein